MKGVDGHNEILARLRVCVCVCLGVTAPQGQVLLACAGEPPNLRLLLLFYPDQFGKGEPTEPTLHSDWLGQTVKRSLIGCDSQGPPASLLTQTGERRGKGCRARRLP